VTSKETDGIKKAIMHIKSGVFPNGEALKILYGLIGDDAALSEIKKKEDAFKQKEIIRVQGCKNRAAKGQIKLDRWNNSPEWFKKYYSGVSECFGYSIFAESEKWAIVKKEGHATYLNRMSGTKYFPATYCLISKTNARNYGHCAEEVVFEGRLRKGDREKITQRLAGAEAMAAGEG
jgi:hypothetical protein